MIHIKKNLLKKKGIDITCSCLLWYLYAGQEATVRTRHGTMDWFQIGKGVHQSCILSSCLLNIYAEYIMQNARLEEAQARIKIAGRNINNLRYADDATFMAESEEELKSLLMKVKEEGGKAGLKLNIQKTKIMACSPIISWQIDGETMETVRDLIFLGSRITAGGDCSHKIKRCLLFGRKAMTNLDSILKSRDITLPTKVSIVKAMVFPVVMCQCESWTIKKAEHLRIDVFELSCWRLLRVPWTARRSNQSILKEINPEYSLEGLMLKLKLQYFGHLMWRAKSLEKTLMLGKIEGRRRRGRQDEMVGWHHWLNGHEFEQAPGDHEGQRSLACYSPGVATATCQDPSLRVCQSLRRINMVYFATVLTVVEAGEAIHGQSYQEEWGGISLVVQQLRLCTSTAGGSRSHPWSGN